MVFARRTDRERHGDRGPPGQRVTEGWPVLTYGGKPRIDVKDWRFAIAGREMYGYHIRGDPWNEERYS